MQRAGKKKKISLKKTLFLWLRRVRAFPAFFFLFCVCLFFSLSLSPLARVCVTLRHITKTHVQKSHRRPSSLSLSLSLQRKKKKKSKRRRHKEERGGSIRFVSDLIFFPLVLVVGRVRKREGERERILIF